VNETGAVSDESNAERFYDSLARRHRLFYADWDATVRAEGVWLDRLLRPLGMRRVLDCTCGIGTQALGLALHDYEVTGCDLSDGNLVEAQRAAIDLKVSALWRQADVRSLDQASPGGPFDAVMSLGNGLPHLLTVGDMQAALRQMVDQVRPGGLLLVGQREWDSIIEQRPHFQFRHEHRDKPVPGFRTVLFDLWHYDDPLVTFEVFFTTGPLAGDDCEESRGWTTEVFPLRYRMWRQEQLVNLMEQAGVSDIHQVDCKWEVRLLGTKR
jgi:glycine/sarcosine N-methyltransferase